MNIKISRQPGRITLRTVVETSDDCHVFKQDYEFNEWHPHLETKLQEDFQYYVQRELEKLDEQNDH